MRCEDKLTIVAHLYSSNLLNDVIRIVFDIDKLFIRFVTIDYYDCVARTENSPTKVIIFKVITNLLCPPA